MTFKQILSKTIAEQTLLSPEKYPKYNDIVSNNVKHQHFIIYPDKSRSFDDIIIVTGMITSKDSPLLLVLCSLLLHLQKGIAKIYFDDGTVTPMHTHNHVELGYVVEGQFHKQINGQDYRFRKGEVFLVNKGTEHTEYLYRKDAIVFLLGISNTFFDKSLRHDVYRREADDFLQRFIIGNEKYQFIRFIPKKSRLQTSKLFEKIVGELWQPQPGTTHLIIGYVERILNLLPVEFEIAVQRNYRGGGDQNALFEDVRHYLENHYRDATIDKLVRQYGHNRNYFNRLIKKHTGITYIAFLQNIRLGKAELLLKTTGLTIAEIALQSGYEDLSYFYRIFLKRFNKTPKELRDSIPPQA
jgi:AraC-like DNA-binding protein/mannose-6-phosphate isomerase-like protein (cupin superfamily)